MNKNLQKMKASGELQRCTRLEILAYICHSIGNQAREEADALLSKHGLCQHEIKYLSSNLTTAFNRYHTEIKTLLPNFGTIELCEDYEKVRHALYVFGRLEENKTNNALEDEGAPTNNQ